MNETLNIKCGNCGRRHSSVELVRSCHGLTPAMTTRPRHLHAVGSTRTGAVGQVGPLPVSRVPAPMPPVVDEQVTPKQLDFIRDLGGDVTYAAKMTKRSASQYIDNLKRMSQANPPRQEKPVSTKIPLAMLNAVQDGYYAVQRDDSLPTGFYRISRPKTGRYSGSLKIQSQHGPNWKIDMIVRGDQAYVYDRRSEADLLMLVVDPHGAMMSYAEKIGKCCRCNAPLTDERSRYYGIGPECEKHAPHIIDLVNDRKGEYGV